MGVRLYAEVSCPEAIEILANVPEGTYARLNTIKKAYDNMSDEYFGAIYNDKNLLDLHNFLMFGWGRVQAPLDDWGLDINIGFLSIDENFDLIDDILEKQGILFTANILKDLGVDGIYWG